MSVVYEKFVDVLGQIADSSVNKADYDKTIQAQILSCEDATIGKYRCKYQDATFVAYSNNSDMTFTKGSYVYVLVPGNDMSRQKTILGSTKKLGINYISHLEQDQLYNVNGTNNVTSDGVYYLDSNNINYSFNIYEHGSESNIVTLDIDALQHYIKQSSSLIVGANFRTQIPSIRQYRGHYGISFNLRFKTNTADLDVIRSYIIDEDNMIDNPYKLLYDTRQHQVFDIDGSNFIRVESIEIFNKDFPNADGLIETGQLFDGDIIISKLEVNAAIKMTENEINGVAISFYTPRGTFFQAGTVSTDYKIITAQVKVKGKLISPENQTISFYWGSENVGVSPSNPYYSKYLGRGWKCLNDSNIIEANEDSPSVVEWVPGSNTHILHFTDATAKDNKIKVAVLYDGNIITKIINIQNYALDRPDITIESSDGTKFYYDIGHPTLTCKVNGGEPLNYTYYWAYESNTGILQELPETGVEGQEDYENSLNAIYERDKQAYLDLLSQINSGNEFLNAQSQTLAAAQLAVNNYKFIQRVKGNKIYDVQIKNITNFGIFKCSVYNDRGIYLGTGSITLLNLLESEGVYSLVINNGSEVFQYNEYGVAPTHKSLDNPKVIQSLTFTIYDNQGKALNEELSPNDYQVRWGIPINDTMIIDQFVIDGILPDASDENYNYYDNIETLAYNIANQYNVKKQRNQIKLAVNYKNLNLTAETNFTFTKQGQPGTNGTEYYVKIIPNTTMNNPPLWPIITLAGSDYIINYGIGSSASETIINVGNNSFYKFFKAQLWRSGELVWEGFVSTDAAVDNISTPDNVKWEVLSNHYSNNVFDASAFYISNPLTGQIAYKGIQQTHFSEPLANIIKCSIEWEDKIYYGTIPVMTAQTTSANYRVNLKDYTGFRYVTYSSDGMSPKYDNSHPFEFIIEEKINNIWEDISNVAGDHSIRYLSKANANIQQLQINQSQKTFIPINLDLLTILSTNGLQNNQFNYRPAASYGGECVNAAIVCIYKLQSTEPLPGISEGDEENAIAKIHVPIHFLLNKYGLSHINDWDGNSIQIDEAGGFILSPQMGAGVKDNNNNFTGILMGEVKTPDKTTSDIGILGYSSGDRTIFLNSANGSALFGKKGNGQIILDPSANRALLYSDNFWKNYDEETGLPTSYVYKNEQGEAAGNNNGQGLLIDLTEPEIRFGSGSFIVNDDGVHISLGDTGKTIEESFANMQNAIDGISELADGALLSDTPHYLASTEYTGITTQTTGWDVNTQLTSVNRYLWCYHTYIKVDTEAQGGTRTEDTSPIVIGVYGDSGQDAIKVEIDSNVGNIFKNSQITATLTCTVYKGTIDITNQVTKFTWKKINADGQEDKSWSRLGAGRTINITAADIRSKAIFICTVEF